MSIENRYFSSFHAISNLEKAPYTFRKDKMEEESEISIHVRDATFFSVTVNNLELYNLLNKYLFGKIPVFNIRERDISFKALKGRYC